MRLTAASYQAAFDYHNAVKTYLELYATTKTAKAKGIKAPDPLPGEQPRTLEQIGLDALYNAALASELNRDFKKALELYKQYGTVEKDRRKLDRALWSIAGIYRQSGDVGNLIVHVRQLARALRQGRGQRGRLRPDLLRHRRAAEAARARPRSPRPPARPTIDAWKARGAIKNSRGAKLAGEWQLAFAEEYFAKTWEPYAIKTAAKTVAEATNQNKALEKMKATAEDKYLALDPYGVAEYTMAAKVRYGDIQYGFATKIADAPIPVPVAKVEAAVEAYENQRDQNLKKYLNEAQGQWVEVLDLAKRGGISNQWSRKAQENLGREFPNEFTVLRQEIIQGTEAP